MLDDLGPEEGDGQDEEEHDEDPPGAGGALPQPDGMELVHSSNRISSQSRNSNSTSGPGQRRRQGLER